MIINQYIGKGDLEKAEKSAGQLLMISFLSSAAISSLILLFRLTLLQLLFGKVNDDVMHACTVYLRVSAYSFPALAVYNSGAALCGAQARQT